MWLELPTSNVHVNCFVSPTSTHYYYIYFFGIKFWLQKHPTSNIKPSFFIPTKYLQLLSWLTFVSWPSHSQALFVDVCLPVRTAVGEGLDLTERPIHDLAQFSVLTCVGVHLVDVEEQAWELTPLYSSSFLSTWQCPWCLEPGKTFPNAILVISRSPSRGELQSFKKAFTGRTRRAASHRSM